MPVRKVSGGYQWGTSGKIYRRKADAEKQGRAIQASKAKKAKSNTGDKKKEKPTKKVPPRSKPNRRWM
jgi:hypothetical protein